MRIGTLADMAGTTPKTIRFYEQAGLLPEPARTASGYRDYGPQIAGRIGFIKQAQAAGLTLAEIRGILTVRDTGHAPCAHVAALIDQHLVQLDIRITELTQTKANLQSLRRRAAATDPDDCGPDEICTILDRD